MNEITAEIRAQVLREAAAHIRAEQMEISVARDCCEGCDDDDCHGITTADTDEVAAILDDLAAREEGRAAYLAEQDRNQPVPVRVAS